MEHERDDRDVAAGLPDVAAGLPDVPRAGDDPATLPGGGVYDWYIRGLQLLGGGNPAAAVQLLSHAAAAEPASRSVREALARAQFDAGHFADARDSFDWIIRADPADDYAQFGLGLAAARMADYRSAVEHLALAAAMRPDIAHYGVALRGARAAMARQ